MIFEWMEGLHTVPFKNRNIPLIKPTKTMKMQTKEDLNSFLYCVYTRDYHTVVFKHNVEL